MEDLIVKLVKMGLDINHNNNYGHCPLLIAIKNYYFDTIACILRFNPIVSKRIIKRYIETIDECIDSDICCNELQFSIFDDLLKLYFEQNNDNVHKFLMRLVAINNWEIFQHFIGTYSHIVDDYINEKNSEGSTMLHLVSNINIAETLLKRGADVNITNNQGETPIFYIDDNELELAQLLLDYGADLTIKNKQGKTPIKTFEKKTEVHKLLTTHLDSILMIKEPDCN